MGVKILQMSKIYTDKKLIESFLTRGVENIYPSKSLLQQKLQSGNRLTVYQGFDPTGKFLHVGHAIGIRALRILQQLGHKVIFLIGDYTAKVGDPDKDTARKILTDEEIKQNMMGWKQQASMIIDFDGDNPVEFKTNHTWLSKLTLENLIELMSTTTVQQMIERDMFLNRLNKKDPIGLHEFIYPLMQGYDSVAMQVDLEIGGNDQTFNMLMGRNLVKRYLNKEKYVRTNQMMEAPDGITMSKTKGNGINLSDSENNMFGKAMSYPDNLIIKGLNLLTDVPTKKIFEIENALNQGQNPMQFKKIMAFEIVKCLKGHNSAEKALKFFEDTVQNKQVTNDIITYINFIGNIKLVDFIKEQTNDSVSNIKRLIEQGGVEVDGAKIKNPFVQINFIDKMVIKVGKRQYFKIKKETNLN